MTIGYARSCRCVRVVGVWAACALTFLPIPTGSPRHPSAAIAAVPCATSPAASSSTLRSVTVPRDANAVVVDQRLSRAYVGASTYALNASTLSVFDTCTGTLIRTIALDGYARPVAVDVTTGTLLVSRTPPSGTGRVSLLDERTGHILRTIALSIGAVVVDDPLGRAFVTNDRGTSMLDVRTGHVLVVRAGLNGALVVDERRQHVFVVTQRFDHGTVTMLDARTGALLRSIPIGARPIAAAADARTGRVFVANQDRNTVDVLDAETGTDIRRVPIGEGPTALIIDERIGRVFVGRDDGSVSVLDAMTGQVLRMRARQALLRAVDEQRGRVFLTSPGRYDPVQSRYTSPGHVRIVDALSGVPLQTFTVGHKPGLIAIDEHTGLAFVVDEYDDTVTILPPSA